MKTVRLIPAIAATEMLIGLSTIGGLITYSILSLSTKPLNVLIFVLISALISSAIGFGIFSYRRWARTLILFFSGCIIIVKILLFFKLLYLSGEIITSIPTDLKNLTSVLYHGFLIMFFSREDVRKLFIR